MGIPTLYVLDLPYGFEKGLLIVAIKKKKISGVS